MADESTRPRTRGRGAADHAEPARGDERGQQRAGPGLLAAIAELDADDGLTAGVLTGAGGGF